MINKVKSFSRYTPYPQVSINNRTWPDKQITHAPIWCSVDLRDGNQALSVPMNVEQKIKMFDLLVKIGFKEIEVGFPAASETEYQFVRKLIEEQRIPQDVTIQVLTQSRAPLIQKTFDSLKGVSQAIVHLYNSTSTVQRRVVFKKNKKEIKKIAVDGAILMQALKSKMGPSKIRFQYSPESFTATELDYALDICHAVLDVWQPTPKEKVILNLPATVELSTPNIYADRLEWFARNITQKASIVLSVHTHNDRGTAVAAAELAVMAGAHRVEGSLFGNGERTGNMDIITMALNMHAQGIDPQLNFKDMDFIQAIYEECTHMQVPVRHPYVGSLVFTAFSGSHQDAIHKGMKEQQCFPENKWDVPYLPIDPQDLGRDYESIIRINSQSGKGGYCSCFRTGLGFSNTKKYAARF